MSSLVVAPSPIKDDVHLRLSESTIDKARPSDSETLRFPSPSCELFVPIDFKGFPSDFLVAEMLHGGVSDLGQYSTLLRDYKKSSEGQSSTVVDHAARLPSIDLVLHSTALILSEAIQTLNKAAIRIGEASGKLDADALLSSYERTQKLARRVAKPLELPSKVVELDQATLEDLPFDITNVATYFFEASQEILRRLNSKQFAPPCPRALEKLIVAVQEQRTLLVNAATRVDERSDGKPRGGTVPAYSLNLKQPKTKIPPEVSYKATVGNSSKAPRPRSGMNTQAIVEASAQAQKAQSKRPQCKKLQSERPNSSATPSSRRPLAKESAKSQSAKSQSNERNFRTSAPTLATQQITASSPSNAVFSGQIDCKSPSFEMVTGLEQACEILETYLRALFKNAVSNPHAKRCVEIVDKQTQGRVNDERTTLIELSRKHNDASFTQFVTNAALRIELIAPTVSELQLRLLHRTLEQFRHLVEKNLN